MVTIDKFSRTPVYEQIADGFCREILCGLLTEGDQMPSVRELSVQLSTNPNTIQKAYRMLEEEGLITSHAGAKSYASVTEAQMARIRRDLLENEARSLVDAMKQMGVTKEEAMNLIGLLW